MDHDFQMRLHCHYEQPGNTPAELAVEFMEEGEWHPFILDFGQPGFLIFVYAMLNCQHMYMRTNAAEHGLMLDSASGSIDVLANSEWELKKIDVLFEAVVQSRSPSQDVVDHIIDRMRQCPVSVNLKPVHDANTLIRFTEN